MHFHSRLDQASFRWWFLPQLLLFAMVFGTVSFAGPEMGGQQVAAQDDDAVDEAADDSSDDSSSAPTAPKKPKTALKWLYDALGIGYILVFLTLSFILVALFIMNVLSSRKESVCPGELVEGFEAHLDEKQYQEAYELAKTDESFLGNVLSAGLAKVSSSYNHAVNAMQEVGAEENMKLDHRLSYLALIGTISPMIGLFGTVHGMISSFYVIANGGGTPDPNELAEGISTALLTTLIGLFIAIPAITAYNILKNRVQRLVLEVGITSENLMGRFEKVGQKKS